MIRDDTVLFREAITHRMGLRFEDGKLDMLAELLRRRAAATGFPPPSYASWLATEAPRAELATLAKELTVGETYFFRNVEQFDALAQIVVPERAREQVASRRLQVMSAGCASGEEAYSLAIVVGAALPDPSWSVSLRAIDINPSALQRAAKARYTTWSLRETPEHIKRAWFRPDGNEVVLDARARNMVQFELRNLADAQAWAAEVGTYDVIFCRNVLMYFAPDAARTVVAHLARALAPGGYLFLGHAETLRGLSQQFHLHHTHGTFYYRRHGGTARDFDPSAELSAPRSVSRDQVELAPGWADAITRASDRIRALAEPGPSSRPTAPRDHHRAWELLRQERFVDALASLPEDADRDADALLLRAVLLAHSGRLDAAEHTCRHLLALDELSAGAHYVMALCRDNAGDTQAAVEHDQIAVYLDPAFAMPRLHLGLLARRAGDRTAAYRELSHALLLLHREEAARVLLFGGGFHRDALIALCRGELEEASST